MTGTHTARRTAPFVVIPQRGEAWSRAVQRAIADEFRRAGHDVELLRPHARGGDIWVKVTDRDHFEWHLIEVRSRCVTAGDPEPIPFYEGLAPQRWLLDKECGASIRVIGAAVDPRTGATVVGILGGELYDAHACARAKDWIAGDPEGRNKSIFGLPLTEMDRVVDWYPDVDLPSPLDVAYPGTEVAA